MQAIVHGNILMPDGVVSGKALLFDDRIRGIVDVRDVRDAHVVDAAGMFVAPGLIDIHMHGYLGADVSDGDAEGVLRMAEGIVRNGVTSWLPTTMTVSLPDLRNAFHVIRRLMRPGGNPAGAQILGVNAEGPFINPAKKGAQAGENILPMDADFLIENADVIRLTTVAPEMPGALGEIARVAEKTNIRVSIGHTNARYDEAKAGIDAGATHITHLFNAMTPCMHRDPGVVGAALTDARVYTELIADAFHVHPALFSMVYKQKADKLCLITDCTRAGGLADGEYTLGGQPIFVRGIECRLADGTIAGSVLKLNDAVSNMARHAHLPLFEAVQLASRNPARAIGVADHKGMLMPGYDADIVLADADFRIAKTFVGGKLVFDKEETV